VMDVYNLEFKDDLVAPGLNAAMSQGLSDLVLDEYTKWIQQHKQPSDRSTSTAIITNQVGRGRDSAGGYRQLLPRTRGERILALITWLKAGPGRFELFVCSKALRWTKCGCN
jgi:hypothetical protein